MKFNVILILIVLLITGCGGGTSYEIELPNDYELYADSNDYIVIYHKVGTSRDDKNTLPPTIVEISWNERFIIAKQYGMKKKYPNNIDNSYEIPDKSKVYYWILDTENQIKYGPYKYLNEFNNKKEELNISNLELKKLSEYEEQKNYDF